MVKVKVQWGKEKYENVELDETQDLQTFKAVLYSLTNVPGAKQKVLYKGSVLKVIHIAYTQTSTLFLGYNSSCRLEDS